MLLVLIKGYRHDKGFHETPERNKIEFVYDTKSWGDYIKASFSFFSITDKQLILNLAPQLFKHIKEVPLPNWCPTVKELLEGGSFNLLLLKLLFVIKKKLGHK